MLSVKKIASDNYGNGRRIGISAQVSTEGKVPVAISEHEIALVLGALRG